MQTMTNTLRYQLRVYLKTSKPVMPFGTLLLLVWLLYAIMPVLAADSYAASATILACVATWIGLTYADIEDPVSEQLLVLKLGSIFRYQLAYTLFLFFIGFVGAILAVALPLVVNAVNSFALYKEPITAQTVLYGLLLHIAAAFMGMALGAMFHPRLFPDRKIALLLACLVLIVSFVKLGIHSVLPFTTYLTWLFPPLSEISEQLSGLANFSSGPVAVLSGYCLLYGAVLSGLRIYLLSRLRFA